MSADTKVWDIWIRIFHWSLVLLILFSWLSAELGGNWMIWHTRAGFITAGLITFRLLWGFWGSWSARFTTFVKSPKTVINYLRGRDTHHYLSHNPLGALGVLGMISLIALQVLTGLFSNDDIFIEGPLAALVSYDTSLAITEVHEGIFNFLMLMIGLHLAAIFVHQKLKGERLVQAMFHGRKPTTDKDRAEASQIKTPTVALLLALTAGVSVSVWLFFA